MSLTEIDIETINEKEEFSIEELKQSPIENQFIKTKKYVIYSNIAPDDPFFKFLEDQHERGKPFRDNNYHLYFDNKSENLNKNGTSPDINYGKVKL